MTVTHTKNGDTKEFKLTRAELMEAHREQEEAFVQQDATARIQAMREANLLDATAAKNAMFVLSTISYEYKARKESEDWETKMDAFLIASAATLNLNKEDTDEN